MSTNHTPGPWVIRESSTHVTVCGADGEAIFHDDKKCPRVMDDARLIAAAPELLEALRTCLDAWEKEHAGHGFEGWPEVCEARAAIAKATGEQP
jgi:hypothetical protein